MFQNDAIKFQGFWNCKKLLAGCCGCASGSLLCLPLWTRHIDKSDSNHVHLIFVVFVMNQRKRPSLSTNDERKSLKTAF